MPSFPADFNDYMSYHDMDWRVSDGREGRLWGEWFLNGQPLLVGSPTSHLNVRDFGAVGNGITDDTEAIQDAIDAATVANGGIVFVPAGAYKVTSTLVVNGPVSITGVGGASFAGHHMAGSRFVADADIVVMNFKGKIIENVGFDGWDATGDNSAAIGLVVGLLHQTMVRKVDIRGFRYAGFVATGTQNSLFESVDSSENAINFWLTNGVENCLFLNASSSDNHDWGGPYIRDVVPPNGRQIFIGQRVQPYVPDDPTMGYGNAQNTFIRGIFERAEYNDYAVEINDVWGWLKFQDCNFQGSDKAIVRLADTSLHNPQLGCDIIFDNVNSDFCGKSNNGVPLIKDDRSLTEKVSSRIYVNNIIGTRYPAAFGTDVRQTIHTGDFDSFTNALESNPTFQYGIAGWETTGTATVTHDIVKRRLIINTRVYAFGGLAKAKPTYSLSSNGIQDMDSNRFIKVKWHCTAKTVNTVVIQTALKAAPWWRTLTTFTALGEGEALYQCVGDEGGGTLHVISNDSEGSIELAYFAAAIY